jgi:hypothetical protein
MSVVGFDSWTPFKGLKWGPGIWRYPPTNLNPSTLSAHIKGIRMFAYKKYYFTIQFRLYITGYYLFSVKVNRFFVVEPGKSMKY